MEVQELVGRYRVVGQNQSAERVSYKGVLDLSLDVNNRVVAKWLIHNSQEQWGRGFFKDNLLVINFRYRGEDACIYKGVAVYKCLTKDMLDGFWSEKYGDPQHLGSEQCFRIDVETSSLN